MAIGMMLDIRGGTKSQYDKVMNELNLKGRMPSGGILHIAGPTQDGWRVIDVWESREVFERFYNEKLKKAAEKAGLPATKPAFFEVHNSMLGHEMVRH